MNALVKELKRRLDEAYRALATCEKGGYQDVDGDYRTTQHFNEKSVAGAMQLLTSPLPAPEPVFGEWVEWSKQKPEAGRYVLAITDFSGNGDWRFKVGGIDAATGLWWCPGASWTPTHWMALPTPPGVDPALGFAQVLHMSDALLSARMALGGIHIALNNAEQTSIVMPDGSTKLLNFIDKAVEQIDARFNS